MLYQTRLHKYTQTTSQHFTKKPAYRCKIVIMYLKNLAIIRALDYFLAIS